MAEQMVTLTISLTNGKYCCSDDAIEVPYNGQLEIIVPPGGCLLCFDTNFKKKKPLPVPVDTTICMKGEKKRKKWRYNVVALDGTCPKEKDRTGAHSIQIGS